MQICIIPQVPYGTCHSLMHVFFIPHRPHPVGLFKIYNVLGCYLVHFLGDISQCLESQLPDRLTDVHNPRQILMKPCDIRRPLTV